MTIDLKKLFLVKKQKLKYPKKKIVKLVQEQVQNQVHILKNVTTVRDRSSKRDARYTIRSYGKSHVHVITVKVQGKLLKKNVQLVMVKEQLINVKKLKLQFLQV